MDDINLTEILLQPLWLNHHFCNPDLIISNWFNHGIIHIKDICEGKNFLTFAQLKMKFDINGTVLDLNRVLLNIPKTWRDIIRTSAHSIAEPLPLHLPWNDLTKPVKGSRLFYDNFISESTLPKVCGKWNREIKENLDWKTIFTQYRLSTQDTKLLELNINSLLGLSILSENCLERSKLMMIFVVRVV